MIRFITEKIVIFIQRGAVMVRRMDLLTNLELMEVRKLQLRILQSDSIPKTKIYEREIRDIIRDAEKRYFDSKAEQDQDDEIISRLQVSVKSCTPSWCANFMR